MPKWNIYLFARVKEKELAEGRDITKSEIAEATELSRGTVDRWLSGSIESLEASIATKFLKWLECEPHELYELDMEGELLTPTAALTPA